jgi:hypothetical protein
MAADNWKRYNKFPEYMGDGSMDMDNDTFNLALFLSTSNCATLTHDDYGDLTNEHANQYGYTTGGQALDSVTWTESSGTITLDSANEVFTASGGPITCRFGVIYDDTMSSPVADGLVCYSLLDNTPADVTATDGNTLTVAMHASGIITVSAGQS